MKIKTIPLLILSFLLLSGSIFGQDKIYKRNQEIIDCKVKEIGTESIKYTLADYPEDVLFAVDKDNVLKVVFADGREMKFMVELNNPENYVDNKKNAIKLDFISPLTGNTTFAFEHSLKPGRSIEAALGIIGLGYMPGDRDSKGVFFKFGYKFIKSPDFYFNKMRYSHILKGGYVKPEISFGYYSETADYYSYNEPPSSTKEQIFTGTLHLILGKQWVFDNSFLVDFFGGIGYGFNNGNEEYQYGYINVSTDFPLSFSGGLKVGFLLK